MECMVCLERFGLERRRPKSLPCGHSVCLDCLLSPGFGNQCPQDRTEFQAQPVDLPDTYALVSQITELQEGGVPGGTFWCRNCDRALSMECVEAEHRPCSLRQVRAERVAPQVAQLRAALAVEERRLEALKDLETAYRELVDGQRAATQGLRAALHGLRAALERLTAAADSGVRLEEAIEAAALALRAPRPAALAQQPRLNQLLLLQTFADGQFEEANEAVLPWCPRDAPAVWPVRRLEIDFEFEDLKCMPEQERRDTLLEIQKEQVCRIRGLLCSADPAFAAELLAAAGPHLEELQMWYPSERHMQQVRGLASLRVLHVEFGAADAAVLPPQLEELQLVCRDSCTLQAVHRLPRLRALRIYYCGDDVDLGALPAGHCGLRKLQVFVEQRNEATLLSLLRAHGASLLELRLRCDAAAGSVYLFPRLAAGLRQCGLRALRRVVLQRGGHHDDRHHDDCHQQLEEARAALRRTDAAGRPDVVAVLCSLCHPEEP